MQMLRSLNIDDSKKKKLLFLCGAFFLAMTILISLISVSLAALTATESIEILSEKVNYENREQGSWKIKKSANWLTKGKVKVTYNIDTKAMIKAKNIDLLLVVNTSNSLSDEQFSAMKSDLNKFSDSILKDGSSSRIALLSFNSTYSFVSDFTSDKTVITSGINDLAMVSGSSYYKGFQGIDEALSNYQQTDQNKLVVIFLTNALPNKDMPNEKAQYNYLKSKYSNLTINAIAYDMGSFVPDKVKEISDSQFNATDDTLNSALVNAADMQFNYENFTIDDYIDTDNFSLDNLDSLKATYGDVSLDTDSTGKKVSINLNNLVSGNKVKISYEMSLNSDKLATGGLFPINKSIKVKSAVGEIVEDVLSEKTPVVADDYKVSYISNTPDGCNISTSLPSSTHYSVFDTVKIADNLVCNGYQFRGWELVSNKNVTMINSNNFLMPEDDVVIKGTWSKLSISKSMDGTVYTPQTLNDIIESQAVLDNIKSTYATSDTGIDFSKDASDTNGKGVYTMASTKDDVFPIHYYRGAVTNNNVKYAGYCWKIVRTTETGGVKLVWNGAPNSSTGACDGSSSTILTSTFNEKSNSIVDSGYMYGERYENSIKKMNDTWYSLNGKTTTTFLDDWRDVAGIGYGSMSVASTLFGTKKVAASSTFTYDSNTGKYTLKSPSWYYANLLHKDVVGKYTCRSTSSISATCNQIGYVHSVDTGKIYYYLLSNGEDMTAARERANSIRWLYGKSISYDSTTGNYALNDTTEDKHISLVSSPSTLLNDYPYSCLSSDSTCSTVYFANPGQTAYPYKYVPLTGGETYESLYANAVTDQYTYKYGNDVTYDESTGMYTLVDSISSHWIDWATDKSNISSNHHYFCTDNQSSCSTVNYIYYASSEHSHYWPLTSGKGITDIYNTLHLNDNDSSAKSKVDNWYSSNLVKYSDYLEDTVWCNDRELSSTDAFDKDKDVSSSLKFKSSDRFSSPGVNCINNNDKFTVSDKIGNGKLAYPVGLLTKDEIVLAGRTGWYFSAYGLWTISPSSYTEESYLYYGPSNTSPSTTSNYINPSVSLKNGLMVYAGNGTSSNPYVLESLAKKVIIEGDDDIKASPGAALPGETINLLSISGSSKIISFDLNGETITGSSFTMPEGDVLINNIVAFKVIIEGNSDIKASPTVASAGETINLVSKSGTSKIISFDLNGETITGSSFTMPNGVALINNIVAVKIIVKGNSDIGTSPTAASPGETVTVISKSGLYRIISFDLNGETITGSSFTMPNGDAVISNVVVEKKEQKIFESEHDPYPNNIASKVYGEHTFERATSLTVKITYQTESTNYDWIYIYGSTSTSPIGGKIGGTTKTTKTLTVPGNYIKIVFRTDGSGNNYYGFRAVVTANYD